MAGFDTIRQTRKTFTDEAETEKTVETEQTVESEQPRQQPAPKTVAPSEPKAQDTGFVSAESGQFDTFNFTCVQVEDPSIKEYSAEYDPSLKTQVCIADKTMLLEYMVKTERRYNVTMSFPAYGVDPIVFDEVLAESHIGNPEGSAEEGNESASPSTSMISIRVSGRSETDEKAVSELYEKIEVDGVLYLSCVSECLNVDYLRQVIAEATEGVYMHGRYIYTMIGPRPLTPNGTAQNEFIETLKLNSYELSVLLSYMLRISGVTVTYGTYNGRSAILFSR